MRTPESTAMSTAMSKPASTPRPPGPIRMLARAGARPSTAAAAQPTPTRPPSRPSPCPRCGRQHNRRVEIPRRPPRSYSATPVHPACKPLAPRKEHLQRAVSAPHTPTEQRPSWSVVKRRAWVNLNGNLTFKPSLDFEAASIYSLNLHNPSLLGHTHDHEKWGRGHSQVSCSCKQIWCPPQQSAVGPRFSA